MWMALWRCCGCLLLSDGVFLSFHSISVCFRHLFIFITHVICYRYFQHRINKFLPFIGLFVCSFVRSFIFRIQCYFGCDASGKMFLLSFLLLRTLLLYPLAITYLHTWCSLPTLYGYSFLHLHSMHSIIDSYEISHRQVLTRNRWIFRCDFYTCALV